VPCYAVSMKLIDTITVADLSEMAGQGNMSRGVDDEKLRDRIILLVRGKVTR